MLLQLPNNVSLQFWSSFTILKKSQEISKSNLRIRNVNIIWKYQNKNKVFFEERDVFVKIIWVHHISSMSYRKIQEIQFWIYVWISNCISSTYPILKFFYKYSQNFRLSFQPSSSCHVHLVHFRSQLRFVQFSHTKILQNMSQQQNYCFMVASLHPFKCKWWKEENVSGICISTFGFADKLALFK